MQFKNVINVIIPITRKHTHISTQNGHRLQLIDEKK